MTVIAVSQVTVHFLSPTFFSASYLVLCCAFLTTRDCKMLISRSVVSGFCLRQLKADLTCWDSLGLVRDSCSAAHCLCENEGHHGILLGAFLFSSPMICPFVNAWLDRSHSCSPSTKQTELLLLSVLTKFVPKARRPWATHTVTDYSSLSVLHHVLLLFAPRDILSWKGL